MHGHLELNARVSAVLERVSVEPGGLCAHTAGETYEADSQQQLVQKLSGVLYQTLHTGRDKPLDSQPRTWREPEFDQRLSEATGDRFSSLTGQFVAEESEHVVVALDGVRVRVPAPAVTGRAGDQVEVAIPSGRPGLSPGFFLATSGVPAVRGGATLRLYARLDDPEAAPGVWKALLDFLEETNAPWRAKISSSRQLYPRNDALVVYLPRPAWRLARGCAQVLADTGLTATGTSPFTHPVNESVGCAFEPDERRLSRRDMSFGQHRTHVLAEALVRHAASAEPAQESARDAVAAAYIDAGIDPSEPARNLSSPVVDVLRPY
ncbi:T3SS effector HopA1 family protein [Streptomyces rochei]|uniref:T3SS effector HopA1 family protein n=1 Tax=Streptomyces rochei TaxID=1928 RepID=UPI0036B2DCF7